jgi:hypothetical protein
MLNTLDMIETLIISHKRECVPNRISGGRPISRIMISHMAATRLTAVNWFLGLVHTARHTSPLSVCYAEHT